MPQHLNQDELQYVMDLIEKLDELDVSRAMALAPEVRLIDTNGEHVGTVKDNVMTGEGYVMFFPEVDDS